MTGREYVNLRIKHLEAMGCAAWLAGMLAAGAAAALFVLYVIKESFLYLLLGIIMFATSYAILFVGILFSRRRRLKCPQCSAYWGALLESNRLTVGYRLSEKAELCPDCGYKLDDELP